MIDQQLVDAFLDGSLPPSELDHPKHVRLVWADLRQHSLAMTLERQTEGLRRFVQQHGADEKFHATITWGFVLLVHERLERFGRHRPWREFAEHNADLLTYHPSPLAAYYKPETLRSELARKVFVLPDAGLA